MGALHACPSFFVAPRTGAYIGVAWACLPADLDLMGLPRAGQTVLLTGATGFVGGAVHGALLGQGWHVRCLTRAAPRARKKQPSFEWVEGDVSDEASCAAALVGCTAAVYLVHAIGDGGDYHHKEVRAAQTFSRAAATAGVEIIVYLGGVAPIDGGSDHLLSRLAVGAALRAGSVQTIELRASMIVGHGSLSWLIVRDLAARLPFMVLPRWLKSRTQPIAIDDVVVALVRALDLPEQQSACFDIPGPETLSGKAILEQTTRVIGLRAPFMVEVPFLTPRLSSFWVRFVTRAQWSVAREVVVGLTDDLLAKDERFWDRIGHPKRISFAVAAERALAAEQREGPVRGLWGAFERARGLGSGRVNIDAAAPEMSRRSRLALFAICVWLTATSFAGQLGLWPAIGSVAVALGLMVLRFDGSHARELLRPSPKLLLLGCAVGAAMAAATYLLYPPTVRALPFLAADTAHLYAAFRGPSRALASAALLPVILGEELVWRGVVQAPLVQRLGVWTGVGVTAVAYALAHAPVGSPVLVAAALGCGLAWGALRATTGSLVPTLVAHVLWDALILLWMPLDGS